MKNISTGTGLCVLGLCVVAYPIVNRLVPDRAAHAGAPVAIVAKAAMGQVEPTIVWYGSASATYVDQNSSRQVVNTTHRAWSDGRVEMLISRKMLSQSDGDAFCNDILNCQTGWILVSDPADGYAASADLNGDQRVDGADLGLVLGYWGDAPRHDIPPSECPLNLVNP